MSGQLQAELALSSFNQHVCPFCQHVCLSFHFPLVFSFFLLASFWLIMRTQGGIGI